MWQCIVITARVGRSHRMRSLGLTWTSGRSLVFDKVGEADDYCLGAAPPGAQFNVDELHIPLSQVVDDDKFRTNMVDCLLPAAKKDSRGRMRKMETLEYGIQKDPIPQTLTAYDLMAFAQIYLLP